MARYSGVFLLAAGTLLFEITLTRIFSIAEWYHFAFMAVGVALLGSGASGSLLALLQGRGHVSSPMRRAGPSLTLCAILFSLTALGSYVLCNRLPLDSFRLAWERVQLLYLAIYYLALTLPFLWAGLAFALLLARAPERTGELYAANLSGSGVGALMAIGVLSVRSSEQGIVVAALLGLVAALVFELGAERRRTDRRAALIIPAVTGALLLCLALLTGLWPPLAIRMSPYKPLPQILQTVGARLEGTWWNASSRVDIVSSPAIRSAPGLSLNYTQPLPPQKGLTVDGDNLQPLTEVGCDEADFVGHLPIAVAYRLLDRPRVLVIEPKGGMDVLAALHHGSEHVIAVESNPLILHLIRGPYDDALKGLAGDPRVEWHAVQGRSFLRAGSQQFDLIDIGLSDSYRAVSWGAYSLSESYLYTVEAVADAYVRLAPHGLLALSRWLQLPPSEETRAWALAIAALERAGVAHPEEHLLALRSFQTILIMAKKDPLTEAELAVVRHFAQEMSYDLVYLPGMALEEANRHNVLPQPAYAQAFAALLSPEERDTFYRQHPFDVRPTTDDRPFFFHYFRPAQIPAIVRSFGRTWQPFGGGGYLVLGVLLAVVLVASALLILLPLLLRPRARPSQIGRPIWPRTLAYFTALGLAYLLVEIPVMQYFILLLDQPTYAFALVLCVLLVASSAGSLTTGHMRRGGFRGAVASVWLLGPLVLIYAILLRRLPALLLGWPLSWRVAASFPLLAPLGIMMGVPFPTGVRLLGRIAPDAIPWAWAANGCASVISSIVATMLAMSIGFSRVLYLAAALYLLAAALLSALHHLPRPATDQHMPTGGGLAGRMET
jgi:spermidine synthase